MARLVALGDAHLGRSHLAHLRDDRGRNVREEDFLRYVARLSRPHQYDPGSPTLGLDEREYRLCEAIYESASPATELLQERDALPYRHCAEVPDYWAELPEDKAPTGRGLVPRNARESMSDGGQVAIRTMSAAARRDGVDVRTSHRVQRLVTHDRAVVGERRHRCTSSTTSSSLRVSSKRSPPMLRYSTFGWRKLTPSPASSSSGNM